MGVSLAGPPELSGQPLSPILLPPPGWRGFPACSQGQGPVIPHKADCLQDGNPRAFGDLPFCLARRPAQALIQKSHRTLQATLFVLPCSGHRGLPQFLEHPELPPGQPLPPPGMHIPCFLQGFVRAQLHVTCSKVLPVKAVCYLLCSTNSNAQLYSVCLCVNWFPHCRNVSRLRARTLHVLFTAEVLVHSRCSTQIC